MTVGKVKTSTFVAKTNLFPKGEGAEGVRIARESVDAGMNRILERAQEYRRKQLARAASISDDRMREGLFND